MGDVDASSTEINMAQGLFLPVKIGSPLGRCDWYLNVLNVFADIVSLAANFAQAPKWHTTIMPAFTFLQRVEK